MKIKIEIDIQDALNFSAVAFVIDRPKIYKDILDVRKKLKIKILDFDLVKCWIDSVFPFPDMSYLDIKLDDYKKIKEASTKDFSMQFVKFWILSGIAAKKLSQKYFRSHHHESMFQNAILCNKVRDAGLGAYLKPPYSKNSANSVGIGTYAIVLLPNVTFKDVKDAYKVFDCGRKSGLTTKQSPAYNPLSDKHEMERDRNWYWRNLNDESPRQIAIKDHKGGKNYYKEAYESIKESLKLPDTKMKEYLNYLRRIDNLTDQIDKAVKRYRRILDDYDLGRHPQVISKLAKLNSKLKTSL